MKIEEQIEAGRALRTTTPRPIPFTTTDPKAVRATLLTLARTQLGRWIDAHADYAEERTRLIGQYTQVARTQYPRENDAFDYAAVHQGSYLGLFGKNYERQPLPEDSRRELIRDTLARWLWLHKRNEYFGKRDPALAGVTPQDCDVAATDALDVEIQRRRRN